MMTPPTKFLIRSSEGFLSSLTVKKMKPINQRIDKQRVTTSSNFPAAEKKSNPLSYVF